MRRSESIDHVAVVGLGSVGRRHLRILKKIRPRTKITIVRSGFGELWSEGSLADGVVSSISEAIVNGVQAAFITSPVSLHIEQAISFA